MASPLINFWKWRHLGGQICNQIRASLTLCGEREKICLMRKNPFLLDIDEENRLKVVGKSLAAKAIWNQFSNVQNGLLLLFSSVHQCSVVGPWEWVVTGMTVFNWEQAF